MKEYVLVDPDGRYVERFVLGPEGSYGRPELLGTSEVLSLRTLPGVAMALREVLEADRPGEPSEESRA